MPGVRIQHPTAKNVRYTVVQSDKPYQKPHQCTPPHVGGCGSVHLFKTTHLDLDETGSVIINDELYKVLKGLLVKEGFVQGNTVKKPPTQGIGDTAISRGNVPIVRGKSDRS